jgi:hypothetical protein
MKKFFSLVFILFVFANFVSTNAANSIKVDKNTLKSIFMVDGEKT